MNPSSFAVIGCSFIYITRSLVNGLLIGVEAVKWGLASGPPYIAGNSWKPIQGRLGNGCQNPPSYAIGWWPSQWHRYVQGVFFLPPET